MLLIYFYILKQEQEWLILSVFGFALQSLPAHALSSRSTSCFVINLVVFTQSTVDFLKCCVFLRRGCVILLLSSQTLDMIRIIQTSPFSSSNAKIYLWQSKFLKIKKSLVFKRGTRIRMMTESLIFMVILGLFLISFAFWLAEVGPVPEPVPVVSKPVRSRGKTPVTVRTSSRQRTKVKNTVNVHIKKIIVELSLICCAL